MTTQHLHQAIKSEYSLDNSWVMARERLAVLEGIQDAGTIRHFDALGVGHGWQCLEIGGGGGSITEWLCRRVGPTGRVVATDINTRFLEALDFGNLEVRVHNILEDELEQEAFDLVHTRAVLLHLSQRQTALERMMAALKPGGVLVVEEPDLGSWVADPRAGDAACNLFLKGLSVLPAAAGADIYYGRRVYADVCALGMVDVEAEGRVHMGRGGTPHAKFWQLSYSQMRDRVLGAGQLSTEELDGFIALFADPEFVWMGPVLMAVSGRRPIS
jgi:2-polyprenyl-3-methyl-5-hydroxy-6-metoxy-1,4-benzoquinol methylase